MFGPSEFSHSYEGASPSDGSMIYGLPDIADPPEPWGPEDPDFSRSVDRALQGFEQIRWPVEASLTPEAWEANLDSHGDVIAVRERIDDLIAGLAGVPMIAQGVIVRLRKLSDSDVGDCLRQLSWALERLAPLDAPTRCPRDVATWITLLEEAMDEVTERGAPSIVVLPAPDGRLDGRVPQRAVTDPEAGDSAAVMFGADATLTVVHQCAVPRPVIEIAALIENNDHGPTWGLWTAQPPLDPAGGNTAAGVRSRVVSCSGVSVGNRDVRYTVIQHRTTSCPVDRAMLLSHDSISAALVRCRDDALDPAERHGAHEELRRLVSRFVELTDASALIPDTVSAQSAFPAGGVCGAALTVVHGMGVAAGRRPEATGETQTRAGHFQIR